MLIFYIYTSIIFLKMDSINQDSDIDIQEEDEFSNVNRRKATNEPVEEPNAKKIRVNIINLTDTKKSSFVWDYFQTENGRDVCKILILQKNEEVECKKSYKHDGGTGNMKQHLQLKHNIFAPNDIQLKSNKKNQLNIDKMISKVTPHREAKQKELKMNTTEWLVTDSLPFNIVNRIGYQKMIHKFDPAFNIPSNKCIKKNLAIAYQKGPLQLKELISITYVTASITTDL